MVQLSAALALLLFSAAPIYAQSLEGPAYQPPTRSADRCPYTPARLPGRRPYRYCPRLLPRPLEPSHTDCYDYAHLAARVLSRPAYPSAHGVFVR